VAAGATVNESCSATGRYLSIRVNGEDDTITLCEVIVIGHRYIRTYTLLSFCFRDFTSDRYKDMQLKGYFEFRCKLAF